MKSNEILVPFEKVGEVIRDLMDTVAYHVEAVYQSDGQYLVTWESNDGV